MLFDLEPGVQHPTALGDGAPPFSLRKHAFASQRLGASEETSRLRFRTRQCTTEAPRGKAATKRGNRKEAQDEPRNTRNTRKGQRWTPGRSFPRCPCLSWFAVAAAPVFRCARGASGGEPAGWSLGCLPAEPGTADIADARGWARIKTFPIRVYPRNQR